MEIKVLKDDFTVCQIADIKDAPWGDEFCFYAQTDEERSLVCRTEHTPAHTVAREDGWRGFRIQGVLDFSLLGILAAISTLLAEHGVSIFAVSTYNTDYILVKGEQLQTALDALRGAGYAVVE